MSFRHLLSLPPSLPAFLASATALAPATALSTYTTTGEGGGGGSGGDSEGTGIIGLKYLTFPGTGRPVVVEALAPGGPAAKSGITLNDEV